MEAGLASLSCIASTGGIPLSLPPFLPRFLSGETSFSPLNLRNPFQTSTARTSQRLSSLKEKCRTMLSKTRKPIEDEKDEENSGEEEAVNQQVLSNSPLLSPAEQLDKNPPLPNSDNYLGMLDPEFSCSPSHRSGYVAILGKPNVGKSTLSNQIIGQKLSIVTNKPQTTRHQILGLCSDTDYQIILFDTPGVLEKKMHKLDSLMMKNVRSSAFNADCVLIVVDACKVPMKIDEYFEETVGAFKKKIPILIVLNKKDLIKPGEMVKKLEWYEKFTSADEAIPVSAKYGLGVEDVKSWILTKLPLGPVYYPKDITSEHPERFFVGEIVREKIFMQYRSEVPYACQVKVVNYVSRPNAKEFIQVEIVVERNSQKLILIGKDGNALKILATASRLDIEDFLEKKVYLEVKVKVQEKWRQDAGFLKNTGY